MRGKTRRITINPDRFCPEHVDATIHGKNREANRGRCYDCRVLPDYLKISAEQLGQGQSVQVRVLGDAASLTIDFAHNILAVIQDAQARGRNATLIIPVGPVDQFPVLAKLINDQKICCRDVALINMDEYLTDQDEWVALDHPLSFRGFMNRNFYELLDPALAPALENRIFPDPKNPGAIQQFIQARNGVDACFGGIGINGHIAFNEPPEPGEKISLEQFATLPTRVLSLARETRTINSVTVGGEISVVPRRAVTIGLKEILGSRALRFYCNRPWQSAVARKVLHGPISPDCPASLLRKHGDARLTLADFVAAPPDIQLR
jgi:glucosamine-6-phosphate deaminase